MDIQRRSVARLCAVALFIVSLSSPLSAQRGAITLPQNLAELVDEAVVIVRGDVVRARVEPHPELKELQTVVVTLRVDETLKGSAGPMLTFRQFIWDARDRHNAAGYAKGQSLLLLLIKPSPYDLSSPAGLEQGRFRILHDAAGKQVAVNGRGNAALFQELGPQLRAKGVQLSPRLAGMIEQPPSGPIPLDDLRELILQIQRGK